MNIRQLVIWITFLAVFAMAAKPSLDSDTWWHLRAGQWMLENRAIPQADPFSYTRQGAAWQYPGWLVEAPMALIYRYLGRGGLNLWTALMITLAFVFVWRTLSGGVFLRAFIIILAAAASGIYWAARPYLVTFLLAAVFLWILEDFCWRAGDDPKIRRRLYWLPALMLIWANSHGGFIVGFILLGVYAFSEVLALLNSKPETGDWRILEKPDFWTRIFTEQHKNIKKKSVFFREIRVPFLDKNKSTISQPEILDQLPDPPIDAAPERPSPKSQIPNQKSRVGLLFLVGVLMLVAVCLNPSGPVMLLYPFKTLSIGALGQYIQEWQPPNFHSIQVQPFVWLLLLTFGAVGVSRRRLALTDFLLVAGFAYLSFDAARNIALFALAAPPVLARHAAPLAEALARRFGFNPRAVRASRWMKRLNAVILAVLGLAVIVKAASAFTPQANQAEIEKSMPVEAVNFIRSARPPGRLFNSYNWGGYLLWELPEYPVFIDGRTDLYDDALVNEWLQVVRAGPGWQSVLDRWGVRLVLLEPGTPVVSFLQQNGWERVYQDETAVVYGR